MKEARSLRSRHGLTRRFRLQYVSLAHLSVDDSLMVGVGVPHIGVQHVVVPASDVLEESPVVAIQVVGAVALVSESIESTTLLAALTWRPGGKLSCDEANWAQ